MREVAHLIKGMKLSKAKQYLQVRGANERLVNELFVFVRCSLLSTESPATLSFSMFSLSGGKRVVGLCVGGVLGRCVGGVSKWKLLCEVLS